MTQPDKNPEELSVLAGQLTEGILALVRQAKTEGIADGLELAAKYIDGAIMQARIIGDALAILLIIRDQIRLLAVETTTTLTEQTEEPHAHRARS